MTVEFRFDGDAPVAPRDAATVLVLREGDGAPEVFFVRRSAGARFMGGAYVFPGGKLDDADCDPAIPCDLTADEAAARLGLDDPPRALGLHVCALRECLEESGILLSTAPVPPDTVAALRAALAPRQPPPLADLFAGHGVTLAVRGLAPLARWITPRVENRRFDARFFITRSESRHETASHDGSETVDSAWLSPAEAIARALRKELILAPPTWRTLDTLRHARNVDEAMACAGNAPVAVEPEVTLVGDAPCVVMPTACAPDGATLTTRFLYEDGLWTPID